MVSKGKIIWVDDEIELLRSHIIFMEERGYEIKRATNADDAIAFINQESFDMVLLDEMMCGKDGLTALAEIKENFPSLPVVMVTKSEEESLMEDAIGSKIDDYLTKPVNPSQILLTCKRILESTKIAGERISRDYITEFNEITQLLGNKINWQGWIKIYCRLCEWEIETDLHTELGLKQTLGDQNRDCNVEFAKFIESNYPFWLNGEEDAPILSNTLVKHFVIPHLKNGRNVVFFILDNLRLDQMLTI